MSVEMESEIWRMKFDNNTIIEDNLFTNNRTIINNY